MAQTNFLIQVYTTNELPEDIKSKINNGFGFETESELYDFLESYSS